MQPHSEEPRSPRYSFRTRPLTRPTQQRCLDIDRFPHLRAEIDRLTDNAEQSDTSYSPSSHQDISASCLTFASEDSLSAPSSVDLFGLEAISVKDGQHPPSQTSQVFSQDKVSSWLNSKPPRRRRHRHNRQKPKAPTEQDQQCQNQQQETQADGKSAEC
jgi:hypothetical protein